MTHAPLEYGHQERAEQGTRANAADAAWLILSVGLHVISIRLLSAIVLVAAVVAYMSTRRVEVAVVDDKFRGHIEFILRTNNIDARFEGGRYCVINVPKRQKDAATKILKEDTELYGYGFKVKFR